MKTITIKDQLDDMRNALRLLKESEGRYNSFVQSGGEESAGVTQFYALIEEALQKSFDVLQKKIDARRRLFNIVPVLQVQLFFKGGKTRRVPVSKPTDAIDEPYIGEMFYASLVSQGVVSTLEDYPVFVVDRRGRIVAQIPTSKMLLAKHEPI